MTWLMSTNGSTDVQRSPVCSSQILMIRLSAERSLRSSVGVFIWINCLIGSPMPWSLFNSGRGFLRSKTRIWPVLVPSASDNPSSL